MSLAVTPTDFIESLSSLVDGTDLVNLLRCGCKQLNQTVRASQLNLQFDANHVGFLDVPRVLISIANDFPRAWSLILLGWSNTGIPTSVSVPGVFDIKRLATTRLNVYKFGYIGTGAFVEAVVNCFRDLKSSLDDVFPNVREWTAGNYLHRFHHPSLRPIHTFPSYYGVHGSMDIIPK